jgi:hypothetical protein
MKQVDVAHELKSRFSGTSALLEKCRKQGYLKRAFVPREMQTQVAGGAVPPLLWIAPGANPLWIRRLIEYGSGFHTGSVYTSPDALAELPGERRCDKSVIAIHASPTLHAFEDMFGAFFPGDCDKCMLMFTNLNASTPGAPQQAFGFKAAIGVVREPFRSIYEAYVERFSSQLHFYATMIPRDIFSEVRVFVCFACFACRRYSMSVSRSHSPQNTFRSRTYSHRRSLTRRLCILRGSGQTLQTSMGASRGRLPRSAFTSCITRTSSKARGEVLCWKGCSPFLVRRARRALALPSDWSVPLEPPLSGTRSGSTGTAAS